MVACSYEQLTSPKFTKKFAEKVGYQSFPARSLDRNKLISKASHIQAFGNGPFVGHAYCGLIAASAFGYLVAVTYTMARGRSSGFAWL